MKTIDKFSWISIVFFFGVVLVETKIFSYLLGIKGLIISTPVAFVLGRYVTGPVADGLRSFFQKKE